MIKFYREENDMQVNTDLFKHSTITEILSMLQSLLDSRELRPQEALALAGAIHIELSNPQGEGGSVYAQYARTMALLQYEMPDTLEYVVVNWQLANLKRTM